MWVEPMDQAPPEKLACLRTIDGLRDEEHHRLVMLAEALAGTGLAIPHGLYVLLALRRAGDSEPGETYRCEG